MRAVKKLTKRGPAKRETGGERTSRKATEAGIKKRQETHLSARESRQEEGSKLIREGAENRISEDQTKLLRNTLRRR